MYNCFVAAARRHRRDPLGRRTDPRPEFGVPRTDPQGALLGTGFIVADGVIVTAKHVVDALDQAAGQALHVDSLARSLIRRSLRIRAGFIGTGGRLLSVAPEHDLALIEVGNAAGVAMRVQIEGKPVESRPKPARLSTSNIRDGTPVAVSGYPLNEPSLVTTAGVLATSFSLVDVNGTLQERHLGDFTANPGNSGGPVYSIADAQVVGCLRRGEACARH